MLFSSTGVEPTFTVPLTLPLTRCGAPGGNKTTFLFEEGTKLFTNRQNEDSLRFYLQVDSGVRFHRNRTGSGSSSRWGSQSRMHSGSTAAGTCSRKEPCQSRCCRSFKCLIWFLLLSIIRQYQNYREDVFIVSFCCMKSKMIMCHNMNMLQKNLFDPHIPGTRFPVLCGVMDHWEREMIKSKINKLMSNVSIIHIIYITALKQTEKCGLFHIF